MCSFLHALGLPNRQPGTKFGPIQEFSSEIPRQTCWRRLLSFLEILCFAEGAQRILQCDELAWGCVRRGNIAVRISLLLKSNDNISDKDFGYQCFRGDGRSYCFRHMGISGIYGPTASLKLFVTYKLTCMVHVGENPMGVTPGVSPVPSTRPSKLYNTAKQNIQVLGEATRSLAGNRRLFLTLI